MTRRCLPAEWHPQDAILLTWPHPASDWAGRLDAVENVYLDLVGVLSHNQDILIQIHSSLDPERLKILFERESINQARCHLIGVDGNDTWTRDHGPLTVLDDAGPRLLDFTFNGWGGKFAAVADNALNHAMAALGAFAAPLETIDWVLEGGSIESDGAGTLLTTRACLLNPNRNGRRSEAEVTERLLRWFGADRVLWLDNGALAGDDTDAHIDTLARFAPGDTLIYQGCDRPDDDHYAALTAMTAELAALRTRTGRPYHLIELPWPDAQYAEDGRRLPASYANFLITNQLVLMPAYGCRQDSLAAERLAAAFPDRRLVSLPCRELIEQGGSLHCITLQLPAGTLAEGCLDQI